MQIGIADFVNKLPIGLKFLIYLQRFILLKVYAWTCARSWGDYDKKDKYSL